MSKLIRGLVLGAMVAVLSSATAAAAQQPSMSKDEAIRQYRAGERTPLGQPVSGDQAVQQFRAGERAALGQPVGGDDAVQRFRAGERASVDQAATGQADQAVAQQRRWYYESTRPVTAPAQPAATGDRSDPSIVLLVGLGAAAALALGLDALSVRRRARKEAHPAT